MTKINIKLDLFQMEQLHYMVTEITNSSDKDKFIIDDVAFNDILAICNSIQKYYNEALDDIGFTVADHFKDKLDYPDKCDRVVQFINNKYQNE